MTPEAKVITIIDALIEEIQKIRAQLKEAENAMMYYSKPGKKDTWIAHLYLTKYKAKEA